ncbi:hypothetical protein HMI01_14860 [Halolactibacillus miurensis]|uniref:Uncharacterized protein n=1 Tax=Halolactibacillus miurensis TaxID=306541 RepID=A0ABQ0VTL1_9BACI|nr:hypothetical protein HMI01_14860 [Halolactibacillus miurensis]
MQGVINFKPRINKDCRNVLDKYPLLCQEVGLTKEDLNHDVQPLQQTISTRK